jgi:hypothetical protein
MLAAEFWFDLKTGFATKAFRSQRIPIGKRVYWLNSFRRLDLFAWHSKDFVTRTTCFSALQFICVLGK